MGHGHDHSHGDVGSADQRWIGLALALTVGIMVAEVVVGLLAGSIALLADAAHNVTDAASIGLALVAARLAARPVTAAFTFGWKRSEILSAQVNGASLVIFAGFIAYDSIRRLGDPPEVEAGPVIALGVIGGLVNVGAAWAISKAQRRSLNVEGAMQHVLADLYGSVAAIVAGVVIVLTDFGRADPIAALVVVAIMLRSGWALLRDSSRILLEASPKGVDTEEVGSAMVAQPGVREVHDLHVWEVTSGFPALAAHVLVGRADDCHACRRDLERMLHERFAIGHTTLQVDHLGGELLDIRRDADGDPPRA